MADGTKNYRIVINGLEQAISQVDALNGLLDNLEERIKSLDGKSIAINVPTPTVNVNAGSMADTNKRAELSEQEKLLQQIATVEEKIAATRSSDYQELIRMKDELKEVKKEQEAIAASSKLLENNYAGNTMNGLKEQLKDIKRVLGETEIGSPQFKELTEQADELNKQLKEIEKSYGQFGRNVGNYESAADGFKTLKIQVGDTTREFNNAKEALRELKSERDTLAMMGEDFSDIDIAVKRLQSSLKDLSFSSSAMDNMLDTMQSFVAIASTVKGLGGVFGIDNEKIEETIKKLVALQSVLQGLETIQKQIQTGEGIGRWLSAGNAAIDRFTISLLGTRTAAQGASTAIAGAATATRTATTASKALGVAMKGMGIGAIVAIVTTLISKWDKFDASVTRLIPGLEKFGGLLGWVKGLLSSIANIIASIVDIVVEVVKGNWSNAWDIIKEQWNEGWQDAIDDRTREIAAAAAKEIQITMDMLEAEYGEQVKYTDKYRQLMAKRNQYLRESYNPKTEEGQDALSALEISEKAEERQYREHAREMARLQREADDELTRMRINNMKEGLNKQITQLEEERRQKLLKIRENGRNVRELELETNRYYDNMELEARKEYADNVVKIYSDMYAAINELTEAGDRRRYEMAETELDNAIWQKQNSIGRAIPQTAFTYGVAEFTSMSAEELNIAKEFDVLGKKYREYYIAAEEALMETKRLKEELEDPFNSDAYEESLLKTIEASEKVNEAYKELIAFTEKYRDYGYIYDEDVKDFIIKDRAILPFAGAYRKDIEAIFNDRMNAIKNGYEDMIEEQNNGEKAMLEQRKQLLTYDKREEFEQLKQRYDAVKENTDKWLEGQLQTLEDNLNRQLLTEEEYEEKKQRVREEAQQQRKKAQEDWQLQAEDITKKYHDREIQLIIESNEKIMSNSKQYYTTMLQEFRDYQSAINDIASLNPVYNNWQIFDWKKNSQNIKDAQKNLNVFINFLTSDIIKLNNEFDQGLIDSEVFESTNREFSRMLQSAVSTFNQLEEEAKQMTSKLLTSLQPYVQAFGQTLSSVLDAVWAAQDAQYEKEKDAMEKQLDAIEENLDKQKDLIKEYADEVNDIEDELSTARGDRRQELIDQLNTEKAAQRQALAEQKRLEKEREKLEEKQEKLELEQRKREQRRDVTQAIINASMAVSYAAVNHWPQPALALMAAAAIQGAAQVAAIKAQRFKDGGIIQGKSHAAGGVKVLGGSAEVEGGEFITNRISTAKNVELLEYVNARKKRIDLADMLEFFNSDGKAVIKKMNIGRSTFAEGGVLPTLRNDLNVNSRIIDAIESVADRPSYVSVVEINDAQDNVNQVKVLAGLRE